MFVIKECLPEIFAINEFTILVYWSPVCTPLISLFIIIEMGMNWLQQHTEIWRVGSPVKLPT